MRIVAIGELGWAVFHFEDNRLCTPGFAGEKGIRESLRDRQGSLSDVYVFDDNGHGVRGDMKAVIKAILLDYDARGPSKTGQGAGKGKGPMNLSQLKPPRGQKQKNQRIGQGMSLGGGNRGKVQPVRHVSQRHKDGATQSRVRSRSLGQQASRRL